MMVPSKASGKPEDRYNFYSDFSSFHDAWCGSHFGWDLKPTHDAAYRGALRSRDYQGVVYSDILFDALSGDRRGDHIDCRNHYVGLNLFVQGEEKIIQKNGVQTVAAEELFLWDSRSPMQISTEVETRCLSIFVPRALFDRHMPASRWILGRKIDCRAGMGWLFAAHLRNLHDCIDTLSNEAKIDALNATLDMLAASCRLTVDTGGASDHLQRTYLRVIRHIDDNLGNADLRPADCARHLGLSERYLRRVLATFDTNFMGYVRTRRLDMIAERLRAPQWAGRGVSDIASTYGFYDPSHFSRLFLARFGVSPTTYRRLGAMD